MINITHSQQFEIIDPHQITIDPNFLTQIASQQKKLKELIKYTDRKIHDQQSKISDDCYKHQSIQISEQPQNINGQREISRQTTFESEDISESGTSYDSLSINSDSNEFYPPQQVQTESKFQKPEDSKQLKRQNNYYKGNPEHALMALIQQHIKNTHFQTVDVMNSRSSEPLSQNSHKQQKQVVKKQQKQIKTYLPEAASKSKKVQNQEQIEHQKLLLILTPDKTHRDSHNENMDTNRVERIQIVNTRKQSRTFHFIRPTNPNLESPNGVLPNNKSHEKIQNKEENDSDKGHQNNQVPIQSTNANLKRRSVNVAVTKKVLINSIDKSRLRGILAKGRQYQDFLNEDQKKSEETYRKNLQQQFERRPTVGGFIYAVRKSLKIAGNGQANDHGVALSKIL